LGTTFTTIQYNKESTVAKKTGKPASKSEILASLAGKTELSRKQVASVLDGLSDQIGAALGKKGPGVFVIPGLVKILVLHKPAQPAREGINPFTKEKQIFKAKPARNVVKVRPLKKLKAMC
jgi:nucleoid DNA-binding protein